jgi:hypothetical protein
VIERGDVWWADLEEPRGSAPGFRRPVVIVQSNAFNRSRIQTVVAVTVTSSLRLLMASPKYGDGRVGHGGSQRAGVPPDLSQSGGDRLRIGAEAQRTARRRREPRRGAENRAEAQRRTLPAPFSGALRQDRRPWRPTHHDPRRTPTAPVGNRRAANNGNRSPTATNRAPNQNHRAPNQNHCAPNQNNHAPDGDKQEGPATGRTRSQTNQAPDGAISA